MKVKEVELRALKKSKTPNSDNKKKKKIREKKSEIEAEKRDSVSFYTLE